MTSVQKFLAMDLGAESGRGELVTLRDDRVTMEEIHRFSNRPIRLAGTLHWDFPSLFAEVVKALGICHQRHPDIASLSVDTWGVDFGLLGADGKLLGNPVHYRDCRTNNIHEYSNQRMSTEEIFSLTGYEPWAISSLFQLLSMQRDDSGLLHAAETFLNMPDLFTYYLTGQKRSELSILNTSNLLGVDGQWAKKIISAFDLPQKMFCPLIAPANVVGSLSDEICQQTHLPELPVIATCGHDTSAALAAVPAEGDNWAFLSCGTWSILGTLVNAPIATPECLALGFTNEFTLGGWYVARNILGLWLVQELRRKWDNADDPWDYDRLSQEASAAKTGPLVDASDPSLLAPNDMEQALLTLIRQSGQTEPENRGQLVRGVLESLALEYAVRLTAMGRLTGRDPEVLYLVGGGSKNKLLCQLTSNACGLPVYAGVDQCTALGNALCQALALGFLSSPDDIRHVIRRSFELSFYEPCDAALWADKRGHYARLASV